jgi:hypothetical protein
MITRKINEHFKRYVDSGVKTLEYRKNPQSVAALFGTDQIEVDLEKGMMKLPEFGWFTAENVKPKKQIGWVAVIKEGDSFYIAIGKRGLSPYSEEAAEILPTADGVILAMPFIDQERIKEKMIAT